MSYVETESRDQIALLRLNRPPVNALDVETLTEFSDRLDALQGQTRAVVLTGAGSTFTAGADLKKVLSQGVAYIGDGIAALTRAFRTLFLFPHPVVAAVNGHALAGGAVLACGCDYRVMGTAGLIGAVELQAGVPFPAWALELIRFGVNNEHLQEVVISGRAYSPQDALRKGLIDEAVSGDPLERAFEVATELSRVPAVSFSLTKRALREAAADAADRLSESIDEEVAGAWKSQEVLDAVRRRMERSRG